MNKAAVLVFVVLTTWQFNQYGVDAGLLIPGIARNISMGVRHGAEVVIQGARDILPWHSHRETPAVLPNFSPADSEKPVVPNQFPHPLSPPVPTEGYHPTPAPSNGYPTPVTSNLYPAPTIPSLTMPSGETNNRTIIDPIHRCEPGEKFLKTLQRCAKME